MTLGMPECRLELDQGYIHNATQQNIKRTEADARIQRPVHRTKCETNLLRSPPCRFRRIVGIPLGLSGIHPYFDGIADIRGKQIRIGLQRTSWIFNRIFSRHLRWRSDTNDDCAFSENLSIPNKAYSYLVRPLPQARNQFSGRNIQQRYSKLMANRIRTNVKVPI